MILGCTVRDSTGVTCDCEPSSRWHPCRQFPLSHLQVAENTGLLKEFRDNIISILGRMDAMGGVMRQMPVLPVRGNQYCLNGRSRLSISICYRHMTYHPASIRGRPLSSRHHGSECCVLHLTTLQKSWAAVQLPTCLPLREASWPSIEQRIFCFQSGIARQARDELHRHHMVSHRDWQVALNAELARNFLGDPGSAAGLNAFVGAYRGSEGLPLYPPIPGLSGVAGSAGVPGQLGAAVSGYAPGGMPSASGGFLGPAAAVAATQSQPPPAVGVPMDSSPAAFPQPSSTAPLAAVKAEPVLASGGAIAAQPLLGQAPLPGMSQPAASIPVLQPSLGAPPPFEATTQPARPGAAPQLTGSVLPAAAPVALQHPLPAPTFAASVAGVPATSSAATTGPAGDIKPQMSVPLPAPSAGPDVAGRAPAVSIAPPDLRKPAAEPASASVQPQPQPPGNSLSPVPGIYAALPPRDGKSDATPMEIGPSWLADGGTAVPPIDPAAHIPPESAVLPPDAEPAASAHSAQPLTNGGSGVPVPTPTPMASATQPQEQPRPAARGPKAEPKVVCADGIANNGASAKPLPSQPAAVSPAAAQPVRVSGNGRPVRSPKGKKVTGGLKGAKPVAAGSGQESKR